MPRKSVVRLTDHPNITLDVYRGHKTTTQQQISLTSVSCFLQVKNGEDDFGWGMVVNFQKKANQSKVSVGSYKADALKIDMMDIVSL